MHARSSTCSEPRTPASRREAKRLKSDNEIERRGSSTDGEAGEHPFVIIPAPTTTHAPNTAYPRPQTRMKRGSPSLSPVELAAGMAAPPDDVAELDRIASAVRRTPSSTVVVRSPHRPACRAPQRAVHSSTAPRCRTRSLAGRPRRRRSRCRASRRRAACAGRGSRSTPSRSRPTTCMPPSVMPRSPRSRRSTPLRRCRRYQGRREAPARGLRLPCSPVANDPVGAWVALVLASAPPGNGHRRRQKGGGA